MYKPNFNFYQAPDDGDSTGGGWTNNSWTTGWGQGGASWGGGSEGDSDTTGALGGNYGRGGYAPRSEGANSGDSTTYSPTSDERGMWSYGQGSGLFGQRDSQGYDPNTMPVAGLDAPKEISWGDKALNFLRKYGPKAMGAYATMQYGPLAGILFGGINGYFNGDQKQSGENRFGQGISDGLRGVVTGGIQNATGVPSAAVNGAINAAQQRGGLGVQGTGATPNQSVYEGGLGSVLRSGTNYYNTKSAMGDLDAQKSSLAGLYSQDGAFAQNLRNQLAARGSAAGTRGQTSSAETALQAELAKLAVQTAPQMASIDANRQAVRNNRNAQIYNVLSDVFR